MTERITDAELAEWDSGLDERWCNGLSKEKCLRLVSEVKRLRATNERLGQSVQRLITHKRKKKR